MYTCILVYTSLPLYIYTYSERVRERTSERDSTKKVCVHTELHEYTYKCTYTYISYVDTYIYICTYVYRVHTHTQKHTHALSHTHIHTNTYSHIYIRYAQTFHI